MKTFKSLYEELDFAPTHSLSLSELIFTHAMGGSDMSDTSIVRGGSGSSANSMWLPLSGSMFRRIFPKEVRATVFHVTRMSNFEQLYAIQNSRRAISAFTNMDRQPIYRGIQGGSGLVVEVDGNILAAAREDLMSIPETSGRRMMAFNWFRGPWGSDDVKKMQKGLEILLKVLIKKYGKAFDGDAPKGKDDFEKWMYMHVTYENSKVKNVGRIMQSLIKDYLDGVEKVFKKNSTQVQDTLTRYMQRRKTDDNWDEIVIDDFEIKKVWIIEDADEMISDAAEEFKSNITSTKLPVEITNAQNMEAHVRDVAMKVTGRS